MIDALFGSKTRVKLLHLFLNNPGKSFYVREITRLIDEQINSVRRELSNLSGVGVITSNNADNKLYYGVNQRYEYYVPFHAIFADEPMEATTSTKKHTATDAASWYPFVTELPGLRLALAAGVLIKGSTSSVDLLLVGKFATAKLKRVIKEIEAIEGRELNYSVLAYDDFYYRLSVRDRFLSEVLQGKHTVLADTDNILNFPKE